MTWEQMSIGEYADLEARNGTRVFRVNGGWWRQVRPFFYRPLFPFTRIVPGAFSAPLSFRLGGYQHLVPDLKMANSHINYFILDDIHSYSLDKKSKKRRKGIRKALRDLEVRQVNDLEEFVTAGHKVYLSFYQRTRYFWKNERTRIDEFRKWAKVILSFPKVLILGAFYQGKMIAAGISYLVEDTIIYATYFSSTEHLEINASELICHIIRERAVGCDQAKRIYLGNFGITSGIDFFKLRIDGKAISEPAFFHINPVLQLPLRRLSGKMYRRIVGLDADELEGAISDLQQSLKK